MIIIIVYLNFLLFFFAINLCLGEIQPIITNLIITHHEKFSGVMKVYAEYILDKVELERKGLNHWKKLRELIK